MEERRQEVGRTAGELTGDRALFEPAGAGAVERGLEHVTDAEHADQDAVAIDHQIATEIRGLDAPRRARERDRADPQRLVDRAQVRHRQRPGRRRVLDEARAHRRTPSHLRSATNVQMPSTSPNGHAPWRKP